MKGEYGSTLPETTCGACLNTVNDPRVLPCSHQVCLQCVPKISIQNNNNHQNNGNTNLNNNNNINNNTQLLRCPCCLVQSKVVDIIPVPTSQASSENIQCGYCESAQATFECVDCSKPDALPLCSDCSGLIHKGKLKSHIVNALGGISKKALRCSLHGKKIILLCEDDGSLVCLLCCVSGEHKGHNAVAISEARKKMQPKLQARIANLQSVNKELQSVIVSVDKYAAQILQQKEQQTQHLASACSAIQTTLETARITLQDTIEQTYSVNDILKLRTETLAKISIINSFNNAGQKLANLDDLEEIKLFFALPELEQIKRATEHKVPEADELLIATVISAINQLKITLRSDLVISKLVELDPSKEHFYSYIKITKEGTLTTTSHGPLRLNVKILEIEPGGIIDLVGKGHLGGATVAGNAGFAYQGASPNGEGQLKRENNDGGGGGGQGSTSFGSNGGGGGGYGLVGEAGISNAHSGVNPGGAAGQTYGDTALTVLHLGSGGGAGYGYNNNKSGKGGNGGGALHINAWKIINNGTISCNGEHGGSGEQYGSGGGGGSGGSIFLRASEFENKGTITSVGGQGGQANYPSSPGTQTNGGKGGHGRIRISLAKAVPLGTVTPAPYIE